ncbi:phosphotransferase enzyme family protein [Sphaerisporangium aureirubrum]|uniref:Phosphotransferase enzyme family protein n=1 Tax=Sphaerisporangium aureirubrum TaxID=1544736 RepID=A0ABW1NDL1_9ACTN
MADDLPRPTEEPLIGDGVTSGIVRVGDTVRRPVRPFTATIQAYLAHLRSAGFHDAPAPLGVDDQGREVLSYVPGDVPRDPLPADTAGEEVLVALARLIRRLHDAAQGWEPPPDAVWGGTPAAPAAAPSADGKSLIVGHRDYCPGNVVFRNGLPAALIDFDLAKPTTRVTDVANALYYWAPLTDPVDRPPAFAGLDIPARVAAFADAYGLTTPQRQALMPAAKAMVARFHTNMRAAAEIDPVFARFWAEGAKDRLPRAHTWIRDHATDVTARLLADV